MDLRGLSNQQLLAQLRRQQSAAEAEDPRRLVRELQQRQIELEVENRELRETLEGLDESRRRYADLYERAPVPYFTFDLQGVILELNVAAAALLGRERAWLVGRRFAAVAGVDRPDELAAHLRRCAAGDDCVRAELSLHLDCGEPMAVQAESRPLRDAADRPQAVRTVLWDVSADKRAERELARVGERERALRERLEALSLAQAEISAELPVASLETVLRMIVEHARRLTGAELAAIGFGSPAAGFGTWIYSGMRATDARGAYPVPGATTRNAPAGFLDLPVRHRDKVVGKLYLADKRGGGDFSADDEHLIELLAGRVGTAMELARLREAEARERARLDLINEVGRELSATLDYEGVLGRITESAVPRLADCCAVYLVEGGALRPVARRHVDSTLEPLLAALQADPRLGIDNPQGSLGRAFAAGEPLFEPDYDPEQDLGPANDPELRRQLEAIGPRSLIVLPFCVERRVFGLAALAYCTSGRRYEPSDLVLAQAIFHRAAVAIDNARLYRREQEAVRARDDLLAVVAHDLRNPLTSIQVTAQFLEIEERDPYVRERAGKLLQATRRMRRLVDDLLDAAALDAGAVTIDAQPHAAADLVEEALTYLEPQLAAARIHIERELPAEPLPSMVRCDRGRMLEVLDNLLGNAIKFTPPAGTVRIGVRRDGGGVSFWVSDSGPGISETEREHLFDRFWKGQQQGTGLGLYIAKRILEAHGSDIRVMSAPGQGATFTFTLPAA